MADTLGSRIAKLRKAKGITQERLAKLIPIDQSMISYYEKNKKKPSADVLKKIADIFDVSTDYILGRTNDSRTIEEIKQQPFNYSELFTQEDEGQAYILAANLKYKQNLSDETFLRIIDEIARFYNRDNKPLDGEIAAHGPDVPGTGCITGEDQNQDNDIKK
ncbi:helix-turn-helix transcriptional regulator [uncultured Aminobacterium sp.]|jgi:transcriptional regulator with XRE-family HTH domain|uniref:helix-turn-helix domain-containing protein n=1 Tax=uncultured Aminobacterium sp. TaxID=548265 RepID=UPI00259386C6|nr:helix-turn-helix transcriptional regulator [uncultured Aminobacterium sp.]